jgi:DNA-binding NtrC family response regulator
MNPEHILIGESEAMRHLRDMIATVAPSRIPVLIEGPTGSGKELVAALLHQLSKRDGAFVPFNVCALGDSMFEDALFGHVRGAFTGAAGESLGFLREANGGTVFFDEISGLPLPLQAKLLRAVETGVFRPIGAARDARSDFRLVTATNENIADLVTAGRFRADLAFRVRGFVLTVPPLDDRREDIPALAAHFARRTRPGAVVARRAELWLQNRSWPGNVRELRQIIEAAMIFGRDVLDEDSLERVSAHRSSACASAPSGAREAFSALLSSAGWDTARLAAQLGVHRATVYRRAKRLGLRRTAPKR